MQSPAFPVRPDEQLPDRAAPTREDPDGPERTAEGPASASRQGNRSVHQDKPAPVRESVHAGSGPAPAKKGDEQRRLADEWMALGRWG